MAPATLKQSGLRGASVRSLRRPNPTYPPSRVCAAGECQTRLSIYNGWSRCWQHEPARVCVLRARRTKK